MSQFERYVGTTSGMFCMFHAHERVVGHIVDSEEAIKHMEEFFETPKEGDNDVHIRQVA